MVALSNSGGGVILVGVRDDRTAAGRRRDQGVDDDIHVAVFTAHSVGRYEITETAVDETPFVAIVVHSRTDDAAQTSDGRVLIRRGGHNVALFGRELPESLASRSLHRFESTDSHVPSSEVSEERARRLAEAFRWTDSSAVVERWREKGLLHSSGDLTIAGAQVLTDPADSLNTAKFHVDVRSYESDGETSYIRREIIDGPVQEQVERVTDLVTRDIGTEMVVTGAYRHDVPRLPRRVVREEVANAVAHRSYELDASPVVVEVRPDRLVILSLGDYRNR